MSAGRMRGAALGVVVLLTAQWGALSAEGFAVRDHLAAPRDMFFSDYFLFSAQADVLSMTAGERIAFESLLDTCADGLSANGAPRLRCEMTRQRYLMDYRRERLVDRLLDAVQFMTLMIHYNIEIGRQNEAGLPVRHAAIDRALRDAIRVAPPFAVGAENPSGEEVRFQ